MTNYKFPTTYDFITIEEAGLDWNDFNIIQDYGYLDGYSRGYNFEFKHEDTGEIRFDSARFIEGSLKADLLESLSTKYEGTPFSLEAHNGYYPTGRAIFRGYYTSHWDPIERDEYVEEASEEIEALIHQYNITPKQEVDIDLPFEQNVENFPKSFYLSY